MDIRVFRSNAELPDHLRGQILSLIRIQWHEVAGDYLGPQALPEEWRPAHVVGTAGDAVLSYAGIVRLEIEHAGEVFRTPRAEQRPIPIRTNLLGIASLGYARSDVRKAGRGMPRQSGNSSEDMEEPWDAIETVCHSSTART